MKSLKTIIIAGIVLVVLIVASIIVMNIPAPGDTEVVEETSTPVAETIYVVDEDYSALTGFSIVCRFGKMRGLRFGIECIIRCQKR